MTVQEVISELNKIEDKTMEVCVWDADGSDWSYVQAVEPCRDGISII